MVDELTREIFDLLSPDERRAVTIVKLALDCYNSGEGTGLLTGKERYEALAARLATAAAASGTLRECWSQLGDLMLWPVPPVAADAALLAALTPESREQEARTLRWLQSKRVRAIVSIARQWHRTERDATHQEGGAHGRAA